MTKQTKRTSRAKSRQVSKTQGKLPVETDGVFFLKIVLYLTVGAQWVWLVDVGQTKQIPLPVGLIIGVLFASHDHFKIDRKIEYAILLIAAFVGFWAHSGVYIVALR